VARSSGISGDRLILLKFGASIAGQSAISVFACTAFASGTSATTNGTTDQTVFMNAAATVSLFMGGDLDFVFLANGFSAANNSPTWLYAGLTNEFSKTLSQFPTHVIVVNASNMEATNGRIVESPPGTFNSSVYLGAFDFTNVMNRCDPDLISSNVYLAPIVVAHATVDRVFGTLKNCYGCGGAISNLVVLGLSGGTGQGYTVFQSRAAAQKTAICVQNS
jgi:hypothetical protein